MALSSEIVHDRPDIECELIKRNNTYEEQSNLCIYNWKSRPIYDLP